MNDFECYFRLVILKVLRTPDFQKCKAANKIQERKLIKIFFLVFPSSCSDIMFNNTDLTWSGVSSSNTSFILVLI